MTELEKTVVALAEQLKNLCDQHKDLEQQVREDRKRLNHNLERFTARLESIEDKIANRLDDLARTMGEHWVATQQMAAAKPTWATSAVITVLSSITTALAVYSLTR